VLLTSNPEMGTSLGANVYKVRLAIASKGKGKSGGARVITLVRVVKSKVYLVSIYDKSDQETLPDKVIKELVKNITF
jgi:hypothetical protein